MVAVRVEINPKVSRGEEPPLFPVDCCLGSGVYRSYDVAADGQRFVMIGNAEADLGTEIVVVENFFEELRARVGN